jgi:hypothetical protein
MMLNRFHREDTRQCTGSSVELLWHALSIVRDEILPMDDLPNDEEPLPVETRDPYTDVAVV